jgi:hypothetical protein
LVSLARCGVPNDRPQSAIRVATRDCVKRILLERPADVVDLGAVDRPDVLVEIADLAAARSPT